MQKSEFLRKLSGHLKKMTSERHDEIMADFIEHIDYALAMGEDEETIVERLGDPKKIANEYYMQKMTEEANRQDSFFSMLKAIMASSGLSIVNCLYAICVVAVGYIVIASLYIAVCSMAIGGLGGIVLSIITLGTYGTRAGLLSVFICLSLVALCILGFLGINKLAELFKRGNLRFLNMTQKVIKGRLL